MRLLPLLTGIALLSSGVVLGRVLPQDVEGGDDPSQPGPVHEAMNARAGKYTTESVMTLEGMDPIKSAGTAEIESILGGRFLLEKNRGTMMGAPVETLRLWGHNNETGELESVWIYTMSTGMLTMKGKMEEDGAINGVGSFSDAGGTHAMQIQLSFPSETSHVVTMHHEEEGMGEVVWVETFTKKEKK
ncbi:MAG: DUF1579 family protein, partial [Planctomycetota bacterium]|nr:DUF1579 family protein [Planctomycetota bacterium]